jgi:hypothetical protein
MASYPLRALSDFWPYTVESKVCTVTMLKMLSSTTRILDIIEQEQVLRESLLVFVKSNIGVLLGKAIYYDRGDSSSTIDDRFISELKSRFALVINGELYCYPYLLMLVLNSKLIWSRPYLS